VIKLKRNDQEGVAHLLLILVIAIAIIGFAGWKVASKNITSSSKNSSSASGNEMNNGCKGQGPATITASPIALADLLYIQPTGLEIGGHVTPIDHGYFYIKGAMANPATQAPVYAPFDGVITSVDKSVRQSGSGPTHPATYNDRLC
jgi:hypothetical protein